MLTHSLEREVTLEDHLAELREDGALGVGQVHPPDACVSHTALVLLLGLLCLQRREPLSRWVNRQFTANDSQT